MQYLEAIAHALERKVHRNENRYAFLTDPTPRNILKALQILRRNKTKFEVIDQEGNYIEVSPTIVTHSIRGMSSRKSEGIIVKVRQKLPEEQAGGEKYLSIILQRDGNDDVLISTSVTVPTETEEDRDKYEKFKRIGDIRLDYIHPNGQIEAGPVDGNDNAFGIPEGKWYIAGQPFINATARAYQLLVRTAFNVGTVAPLSPDQPPINTQISQLIAPTE